MKNRFPDCPEGGFFISKKKGLVDKKGQSN